MKEDVQNNEKNIGGASGKGFIEGKSGNAGGRPKLPEELKIRLRNLTPLAIDAMENIMMNEDNKPSDRLKAAELIYDRAYGKPIQQVDASLTSHKVINTSSLTDIQKETLVMLAISNMDTQEEQESEEID
jgi:hypothetical protein